MKGRVLHVVTALAVLANGLSAAYWTLLLIAYGPGESPFWHLGMPALFWFAAALALAALLGRTR